MTRFSLTDDVPIVPFAFDVGSESIDLIYIDPPFFSGRQYNVIFGDQNELRSFSDIWEGGMPGYLIWLNARLYEMKRLLKKTGSLFVHCDHHASHYIKVEMDKIFGHENLRNEIIWCYRQGGRSKVEFPKKHDTLLWYSRGTNWTFNADAVRVPYEGTGGFQTSGKGVTNIRDLRGRAQVCQHSIDLHLTSLLSAVRKSRTP